MGRLRQKGKAGAAKAYVTRSAAVKKLQCSLADFRRLCILKGIFPREPRSRKKANKGSSAPTSFYYVKDIAYLAHEPVLKKLREHKAFAKKISRALGRNEWSQAKALEENKPVYRLDHIVKERYPTFVDAVRDVDDALCMIFLFASLPSSDKISPSLVENCFRLACEWQLYVMHTKSLRKAFLSIKGVYYQAEIMDQTVTWLVPYQFTQNIPLDVDVRVMLTFLELYQTILGFVLFKLYTDIGMLYPLPLDLKKDEGGAGVGAFTLQNTFSKPEVPSIAEEPPSNVESKKISSRDVRQTIKALQSQTGIDDEAMDVDKLPLESANDADEEFIPQSSKTDASATNLTTFQSLNSLPQSMSSSLFSSLVFFISRETSRPIFEFIIRSFGGRVGWPSTSGDGSPIEESDDSITHVIVDRPLPPDAPSMRISGRKYVQPQWVIDCINAGKILLEEPYEQGKILPPHLSPFGEYTDSYDPTLPLPQGGEEEDDDDEEDEDATTAMNVAEGAAVISAGADVEDEVALRTAEIAAEAAGIDHSTFEKQVKKSKKKISKSAPVETEHSMNKMMMSNKQKKLYERVKHSQTKRNAERSTLEDRRRKINKRN